MIGGVSMGGASTGAASTGAASTGRRRGPALLAALLLGQAVALPVHAQTPPPETPLAQVPATDLASPADGSAPSASDSQEYRGLVDEALKEYGLGHYEEARTLFLRAHAIQPSARTHRGIGLAEYELRNYPECITQLEAALASNERPLTGQVRAATEEVRGRAARYVARVYIARSPAHANIVVDHVPVTVAPSQSLVLRVGEHLVEARADGFVPAARTITVLGGADMRLDLTLSPVTEEPAAPLALGPVAASPASGARPLDDHDPGRRRWYTSPWLWAAVGVAVVGAGVGVGFAAAGGDGGSAAPYGGSTGRTADGP
jgi:PEGA domain